jgi:hypothetical protein
MKKVLLAVFALAYLAFCYKYYVLDKNARDAKLKAKTQTSAQTDRPVVTTDNKKIEKYFPDTTFLVFYLDARQLSELSDGNGWSKVVNESPEFKRFFKQVGGALDKEIKTVFDVLKDYLNHRIMIGVMPPETLEVEETLNVPMIMVADVDPEKTPVLTTALRQAFRDIDPNRAWVREESADVWSVPTANARLYCSWQKDIGLFFVSMDQDLLKSTLKRKEGKEADISKNKEYKNVRREYMSKKKSNPMGYFFCDSAMMIEAWVEYLEKQGQADTLKEKNSYDVKRFVEGLGLADLRSMTYLVHASTNEVVTTQFLDLGGTSTGIFRLFSTTSKESELASMALVPADMGMYSGMILDINGAWMDFKRSLPEIGGAAQTAVDNIENFMIAKAKMRLDDVFAEMGDEVAVAMSMGESPDQMPNMLFMVRTKSDLLVRQLAQILKASSRKVGTRTVYSLDMPNMQTGGGGLAITYVKPFTCIATSPDILNAVFETENNNLTMATREDLQAVLKKLSKKSKPSMVSYVSADHMIKSTAMRQNGASLIKPVPIDLSTCADLFEPSVSVGRYTNDGLEITSYSQKGGELFYGGISFMSLLPDLVLLRERYQAMICRQRLQQIAWAKRQLTKDKGLSVGTPVTADGKGTTAYDLLTAGLLNRQPICPVTKQPLVIGDIGTPPSDPSIGDQGDDDTLNDHVYISIDEKSVGAPGPDLSGILGLFPGLGN